MTITEKIEKLRTTLCRMKVVNLRLLSDEMRVLQCNKKTDVNKMLERATRINLSQSVINGLQKPENIIDYLQTKVDIMTSFDKDIDEILNSFQSGKIVGPIPHVTLLFHYFMMIAKENDLILDDILDIILIGLYETNEYYKKYPEKRNVNEENIDVKSVLKLLEEPIDKEIANSYIIEVSAQRLDGVLTEDGDFIPNLEIEEVINILAPLFIKESIDTFIKEDVAKNGFDISYGKIIRYYEKKYRKVMKKAEIEKKKEQTPKEIKQPQANIHETKTVDRVSYKLEKNEFKKQLENQKEIASYYQDGVFVRLPEDIDAFYELLNQSGLNNVQINKIKRILQTTIAGQAHKIYPSILTKDYQKEIYDQVRNTTDENIKYYLEEIEAADMLYQEATAEEKEELKLEVQTLIDSICYAKNINQDEIKLKFIKNNQ